MAGNRAPSCSPASRDDALGLTRRAYAGAFRDAQPLAEAEFEAWLAAGRALPSQRRSYIRQFAHALSASAVLANCPVRPLSIEQERIPSHMHRSTNMDIQPCIRTAIEHAGEALNALGEKSVLFAFYRAGDAFPTDRYSVRLELEGMPCGIQASAGTPAEALANALVAREAKRRVLAKEAAFRTAFETEREQSSPT